MVMYKNQCPFHGFKFTGKVEKVSSTLRGFNSAAGPGNGLLTIAMLGVP